ncbi:AAA family ATPase [Mycetocola zhadangensis]|uniref:Helix-turn-helix transcriptional regulator n=1 Tax=Mycetocola zhadangensis TaxID=1164595 RepID=A0A3L7J239_9MICO|nr:LuxR family transcriptional regulator [Mycetocola zhadangensis]RLQ84305.1 helix-turn-helix transcriptional regulator [Mycetocola zhadangensis]GGE94242.1 LuxR family transcriptional regulator [Mycetocola zhadangensis]
MTVEPPTDPAAPRASVLYGRARQLNAIARAAAAVEEHKAQFVLILGESGFGKTALLREALDSLPAWPRHHAVADAYERALPYGVLNQLLSPFDQSRLSPVLANGIDPAASTLTVGAELLALVDASEGATIIAIDDAQWMDEQSARALWFAGRRSLHDRMLILIAARPAPTDFLAHIRRLVLDDERGVELDLGGLSADNVVDLAHSKLALRLPRRTAQRLIAATDGNPLHIRVILEYVASAADPVIDLERRLGDGVLPLAPGFEAIMRDSLERLNTAARTVIEMIAIFDGRVPVTVLSAAIAQLSGPAASDEAVDDAARSGLADIVDSGGQLELQLHHHRVGDAVLADLSVRRRQELHRAAAQVTGGDRGLRHRVCASAGPDEELAAVLDHEAREAMRHHEAERAVRYSLWAATVSSAPTDRHARLVQAGLFAISTRQLGLLVQAMPEFANLPAGVERDLLIGSAAFAVEDVHTARTTLVRAASTVPETLRELALVAVANEAIATLEIELRRYDHVIRASDAALANIAAVQSDPDYAPDIIGGVELTELEGIARAWHAFASWRSGAEGNVEAEISAEIGQGAVSGFTPRHAIMLITRGTIRRQRGMLDEAIRDLEHGIALADVMRPSMAPFGRVELALAQFRQGRLDEASTTITIAVSLADDVGGASTYGVSHAAAALVPAARGERDEVALHVAEARNAHPAIDQTVLLLVDAVSARAEGDRASVIRIARQAIATEKPRAQIEHGWWVELLDEATRPPHAQKKQSARDPLAVLSGREREVAHLAAQGLTNREVAQRLFVTVKGVEYHMGNVLAKLQLSSRRGIRQLLDGQGTSHVGDAKFPDH